MNKSKLAFILKLLVSLSLLGLLFLLARNNFLKIGQLLKHTNMSVFGLALSLFLLTVGLMAYRLGIILTAQKASVGVRELFSLTLIGYFFTNFMPSSVGGDLIKGYYISQKVNSKMTSYIAVFIDRVMGVFSLTLIASIAMLIMRRDIEHPFIFWAVAALLLGCIVFVLALLNKRVLKKVANSLGLGRLLRLLKVEALIKRAYGAMGVYTTHKKAISKALGLSLFTHFTAFFCVYLLVVSLGAYVPFVKIFLIMPVIIVLCMLPVTMNGLGLREWAFVLFFSPNIGDAAALSLSLLYLAMFLLTSLIGGIIYLFRRLKNG